MVFWFRSMHSPLLVLVLVSCLYLSHPFFSFSLVILAVVGVCSGLIEWAMRMR